MKGLDVSTGTATHSDRARLKVERPNVAMPTSHPPSSHLTLEGSDLTTNWIYRALMSVHVQTGSDHLDLWKIRLETRKTPQKMQHHGVN